MASVQRRENKTGTSWRVVYRLDGKQGSRSFNNEEAATRWSTLVDTLGPARAIELLEDETPGTVAAIRTVAEQVTHHTDHLTGVTEGTRRTYRSQARRMLHELGPIPITLVTRDDVAAWVNTLEREGLSGKSIANVHGLVSAAFKSAQLDGLIPTNPFVGMRLPRTDHDKTETVFLEPAEYATLEAAMTEHYRPLLRFLVGTGCRYGEATALQVQDVDLTRGTARIRRAWKATGKAQRELGPTKTKRSNRTVKFGKAVADVLAPLLDGKAPSDFVFVQANGLPIHQASFYAHHWAPAVRTLAGDEVGRRTLPSGRTVPGTVKTGPGKRPRIHDLRHTFASWAIQAGVPLPVIQRQLGHESITTTVDRYGHLAASDFDALASLTDQRLGRADTDPHTPPGTPALPSA